MLWRRYRKFGSHKLWEFIDRLRHYRLLKKKDSLACAVDTKLDHAQVDKRLRGWAVGWVVRWVDGCVDARRAGWKGKKWLCATWGDAHASRRVVNSMTYYTLMLNVSNMAGNPFMNFFWQSLVELPGYVVGKYLSDRYGRRWTQAVLFLFLVLAVIIVTFVVGRKYPHRADVELEVSAHNDAAETKCRDGVLWRVVYSSARSVHRPIPPSTSYPSKHPSIQSLATYSSILKSTRLSHSPSNHYSLTHPSIHKPYTTVAITLADDTTISLWDICSRKMTCSINHS